MTEVKNKKQKILIATGVYPPEAGGPATYTRLMEEYLPKAGWEVVVLPFRIVRHLPKIIRHITFLYHVLKKGREVDVLYAQDVVSVGLPALIAARVLRKPFIVRVPGDYAWEQATQRRGVTDSIDVFQDIRYGFFVEFLRGVQRVVVQYADVVITPSDYFTRLVSRWVPSKKDSIYTVYNGIVFPTNLPQKKEARNIYGFGPTDKVILSAGRMVPWKGFVELVDITTHLYEQDTTWRLVILGDGPDRCRIEEAIVKNQASEYVTLAGEKSREELFAYCRAADVFVLNSSFESFSFQTIEVMCTGTPFVGTVIGSLPELVTNEQEGMLVEYGDKDALVRAVSRLVDDEPFRNIIASAALQKARRFSIERTVRETIVLIKNAYERR